MAYTDIDKPTDYFSVNLWVADDASSRALTGFGHQPDLVWTKHRGSGSINPTITDSVRGGDKQLATATNAAEDAGSHGKISVFGTDGITVIDGTNATYPKLYFNDLDPFGASVGGEYVGWSWKANGSGSLNEVGDIDSTVSANTTSGFSIVSYTGNANADNTVAHGLGSVPKMIILKNRSAANNWMVYHASTGAQAPLFLNLTNAAGSGDPDRFKVVPTSSVFTPGSAQEGNGDGNSIIAYCFAEKKGYSKFGSYTGNGSADGTFVYTGLKPAFLLIKVTSTADSWQLIDTKRDTFNSGSEFVIQPDLNAADADSVRLDILSNGFKTRTTNVSVNSSGATYIYMAFAENPFVTSTGVPGTAR